MRSWLLRLLAGMLALQALTGCAAMRQRLGYALVAPEVEANLGAQVAAQVEKQEKALANAAVQEYVRTVATPLVRRAQQDRPEVQFRLTVLDKPGEVNAFAAPGGYLYVYSGLLLAARDEAELAGVLAHEIGHVVARHSANQLAAQYGLELLASHPDTQDRIRRIEIQIAKLGATTGERRQERFARATASLRR
jgi:predicted Zn-dependent protease